MVATCQLAVGRSRHNPRIHGIAAGSGGSRTGDKICAADLLLAAGEQADLRQIGKADF
jgi:hypothetical protein